MDTHVHTMASHMHAYTYTDRQTPTLIIFEIHIVSSILSFNLIECNYNIHNILYTILTQSKYSHPIKNSKKLLTFNLRRLIIRINMAMLLTALPLGIN